MTRIQQLIDKTLSLSGVKMYGRRIGTNVAGGELLNIAERHVEELESFIHEAAHGASSYEPDQFGMEYVLGSMVVGSVKAGRQQSFTFLQELPVKWLRDAIGSVSFFFFRRQDGSYSCGVAPNSDLLEFVTRCSEHESPEVRSIAKDVIQQLRTLESREV